MRFNPFGKPLEAIDASDLAVLRSVVEGWHIDYKQKPDARDRAAKSLSAFANSYGGWLLYGVAESAGKRPTAERFDGLSVDEVAGVELTLREAASAISPPPYFDHRVVHGPDNATGLPQGNAIVIVEVPPGADPPYVHPDGRIYQRISDQRDPSAITDRGTLDFLWRRGAERRAHLSDRLEWLPEVSKAEGSNSRIHLYLFADPLGTRRLRSKLTHATFSAFMYDARAETGIRFDNAFTMTDGFCARQVADNVPNRLVLTWRHHLDCSATVTVPINVGHVDAWWNLRPYEHLESFAKAARDRNYEHGKILDLNQLFDVLLGVVRRYRLLSERDALLGPFFAKARIQGCWRRIPFLNTRACMDFVESHGIPLVQDDDIFAPSGTSPETLVELQMQGASATTEAREQCAIDDAVLILAPIAAALGLPWSVLEASGVEIATASARLRP